MSRVVLDRLFYVKLADVFVAEGLRFNLFSQHLCLSQAESGEIYSEYPRSDLAERSFLQKRGEVARSVRD